MPKLLRNNKGNKVTEVDPRTGAGEVRTATIVKGEPWKLVEVVRRDFINNSLNE